MSHHVNIIPITPALFTVPPPQIGVSKYDMDQLLDQFVQRAEQRDILECSNIKNVRKRKRKKRIIKSSAENAINNQDQEKRRELHQHIDQWRKERLELFIAEERSKKQQKHLPKALNDNSSRIKEARSCISKLQTALESATADDPETALKLRQLIAVWDDALSEYHIEKTELERRLGTPLHNNRKHNTRE